jgi:hypothetical protein
MINVDPIDALKLMPCESMIYGRASFDGAPFETYFAVKEESRYIKRIPKYNPVLLVRTGLMEYNGIPLVPVLISIDQDMIYESWFNFHATDGKTSFADLARQERLIIMFYNEKMEECRKLAIPNNMRETFGGYINRIALLPEWGMREFDAARDMLYRDYPTVKDLWDGLRGREL